MGLGYRSAQHHFNQIGLVNTLSHRNHTHMRTHAHTHTHTHTQTHTHRQDRKIPAHIHCMHVINANIQKQMAFSKNLNTHIHTQM